MESDGLRTAPVRPISFAIARFAAAAADWLHLAPRLDADELEAAAVADLGGPFVDTRFREPLAILVRSLREEAALNAVGRAMAASSILRGLVNLRSLEIAWGGAEPPAGHAVPHGEGPIFLVGLPRTGTTILHHLMSLDPALRPLRLFESMSPIRLPGAGHSDRSSEAVRRAAATRAKHNIDSLAPHLRSVHDIDADGPEECLWLLQSWFVSEAYPIGYAVPSYLEWLASRGPEDWTRVYRGYLGAIAHLSEPADSRRWLLKCPLHSGHVAMIARLCPRARFVVTYRDAAEVVASTASLLHALRTTGSDAVDPALIGSDVLGILARWAEADARQTREDAALLDGRVARLHYRELVADPAAALERVYGTLGLDWRDTTANAVRTYLAAHPQGRHGAHRYAVEEFGLSRDAVDRAMAPYVARERSLRPAK
jgi:hypothetical protein